MLYLAQAGSRNVRGNSLIQGRDLNLISGGDLVNVGTLRASRDLNVISGGSIYQGGLVDAGNNLQMIAQDSIRNAMASEIRGRQVSLTAIKGDILNDRTAIQVRDGAGMRTVTDAGSTITARENLAVSAGNDITNFGAMRAGGDVALKAGNDINLLAKTDSREKHELFDGGHKSVITTDVKNLASTVTAGGNLDIEATRDVNVLASQAKAGNDLRLVAGQDINVSSASDMHNVATKTKDGKKRITEANDRTTQLASELTAGNNVNVIAARDTTLVASKITAGNEAYLYSGNTLSLLAAQDSTHTLYDMKEKGNWGAKKAQRDEVTQQTNVGTEIRTAGNLTLISQGDQRYQVAKLDSGKDLTLQSGGAITFEGVKDLHDESHTKTNDNAFWVSSKGKGNTDETLRQSELIAAGELTIKAVNGLKIDINKVDQQTVSQSIDAMVKADPQLAWLKEAEQRGDVDWRQVREIHDSFKYSNSGLGPASQIIIAIVMAAVVGPMALSAVSTSTGSAFLAAGAGAVASGAATTATVSAVNNRGNLGAVFKDVTSSDALKGYAISGVTAGLTAAYFDDFTGTHTNPNTGKITGPNLSTWKGVGQFAGNQALQNGTSTLLSKALGQGGSASDALKNALFNTLAAASFNAVGDYTYGKYADGLPPKVIIHAMVGGLLSKATGGDFKTGALAAGANELLVGHLDNLVGGNETLLTMSSQIVGVMAAASQEDADASSIQKGSWIAQNATQYNKGLHQPAAMELEKARNENPDRAARLDAAACALTHCSASVPDTDARYEQLKAAEIAGAGFGPELEELKKTGQFDYGWKDRADDFVARHDEAVTRAGAVIETGTNTYIGGASTLGAVATLPGCVTVVGCLPTAGLGGLAGLSFSNAYDSAGAIPGPYVSTEGDRVLSSFHPENNTPENSAMTALGRNAAQSVAEALLLRGTGKLLAAEYGVAGKGVGVVKDAPTASGEIATVGGKTCVYNCVVDGVTRYVGITDDIVKRGQAHLREKGIVVSKIRGLDNISRDDARAVEQTLIDYHGLGKDGGTLINKINSISSVKNPTKYEQGLVRGAELLKKAGYEGF